MTEGGNARRMRRVADVVFVTGYDRSRTPLWAYAESCWGRR